MLENQVKKIHIRAADPSSTDWITDSKSNILQFPNEMDVEGTKIEISSTTLPTGSVLALKFEPTGMPKLDP